MNNENFVIKNGELKKYQGPGGAVVIPDGVTSIGDEAFRNCRDLTNITIPDSVTSIGDRAFSLCTSLTSIVIPDSVTSIGWGALEGCTSLTNIVIPNSVTSIDGAFSRCTNLTNIVIPDSVTSIGDYAFYECTNLTSIVIPDSVTSIGGSAFSGCSSLTSIVIPDSVTSIGGSAFFDCTSLTSIVIPDSVTSIGYEAFYRCEKLADDEGFVIIRNVLYKYYGDKAHVIIPDSVTSIGYRAFDGCKNITNIVIPDSVTSIGRNAFSFCNNLTEIVLPNSVTSIGEWAFSYCSNIKKLSISDNVTTIFENTFANCKQLESIILPRNLMTIEKSAFYLCENLETLEIQSKNLNFTAASFAWCNKISKIIFPDDFFAVTNKYPAMLIPFIKKLSPNEIAHIWLFHDDKYLALAQQMQPDINEITRLIIELLPQVEKYTPKIQTRLKEYVDWSYPSISCEEIKKMCDFIQNKDAKVARKLMTSEEFKRGLNNDRVDDMPEPIEAYATSLLSKRPLHTKAAVFTKGIPYVGQEKTCSSNLLNILVSEYLYLYDIYQKTVDGEMTSYIKLDVPSNAIIPESADKIGAALDRNSLSYVLENLVYSCSKAYRPFMYAYARFATEESVKKLIHRPPSGSSSKVRYWRENLDEALLFSEEKVAIEHLEKKNYLEKYVSIRGMSVQEFRDQYFLPKWNIDETGIIKSAFGRIGYGLTQEFKLYPIELASGKELRTVSSKTDPDAAKEFKELKKEVLDFYKKRTDYVRSIYITAEQLNIQNWINSYCNNPILTPITQKVIWMDQTGETFMLNNGKIQTAFGADYKPEGWVVIAHVLEMRNDQINAWQEHLAENGKKLLVEQVWEPIAAIKKVDMFARTILSKEERNEFKRVLGRKAITINSESDYSEFDHRSYRYVFSNTGTMHVGNSLDIRYCFNEDSEETELLGFTLRTNKITRELNSILFELGRLSIKSLIRKDNAELLSKQLENQYTAAQIAEYISLGLETNSTAAIAVLLDYKQRNCYEFDPFAKFTLE